MDTKGKIAKKNYQREMETVLKENGLTEQVSDSSRQNDIRNDIRNDIGLESSSQWSGIISESASLRGNISSNTASAPATVLASAAVSGSESTSASAPVLAPAPASTSPSASASTPTPVSAPVSSAEKRPTLLLHSCCGPCSSYVLECLTQYFEVTILFYGPNIQPPEEYKKRLAAQKQVLERFSVKILDCEYDGERFTQAAAGLEDEPEGGKRCTACFALRLEETAKRAARYGFPWYCTTLSVSPHKDPERINTLGAYFGEKYGVRWLPSDFKKKGGYQRSIVLSKEMGLYRQNYCGCLYSKTNVT